MRTMQDKILAAIGAATPNHVELVVKTQYANTGTIYAQQGFDTIVLLNYDFQDNYCMIRIGGEGVQASVEDLVDSDVGRYDFNTSNLIFRLNYIDGDGIRAMVAMWRGLCSYAIPEEMNA